MITLSSDFGWPYPAAMRGVIASDSDARMIDICHEFPRGDVRTAAFWLREVLPYFPPSVHLVVVDPGVGTDRAVLAIRAGEHALVGPDNGVLVPAARELGEPFEAFELGEFDAASATFHGRDVFAPLATRVHDHGVASMGALEDLEPRQDISSVEFPTPVVEHDTVHGEVLVVDGFGNAITNIPGGHVTDRLGSGVTVNGESFPAARSYAAVGPGEELVTIGSHGNVELAVNGGRGDVAFGVEPGDTVMLAF